MAGRQLIAFRNCTQWRDFAARGGTPEVRDKLCLPRLGADGHGWTECDTVSRRRRGYDCLACQ
jgi:hypothetical protein